MTPAALSVEVGHGSSPNTNIHNKPVIAPNSAIEINATVISAGNPNNSRYMNRRFMFRALQSLKRQVLRVLKIRWRFPKK